MTSKLLRTRILTPILLALLLFVATDNAFAIDPNVFYQITARHSGKCLSVEGRWNGAAVIQRDCVVSDFSQQWRITSSDSFYYNIVARHSGRGLETRGGVGGLDDGIHVQQWDYVGAANQNWRFIPLADGYFQIIARHSGRSLDVNAGPGVTGNGAFVQQWGYWGGDNQKWRLTEVASAVTPPASAEGRFRVTLTGFTVNRATVDGLLVGDGRGDEVYAAIEVAVLSSSGIVQPIRDLVSLTYGDISAGHSLPARVKAGDIDPTTGGLQAGNSYPMPGDSPPPGSRDRAIPIVLWEGELRNGTNRNVVVIIPTIWELDDNPIMLGHWQNRTRDRLTARSASLFSTAPGSPLLTPFEDFSGRLIETVNLNYFDHPIGIQGDAFVPFVPGNASFIPLRLLLTFDSAQAAAISTTNSSTHGRGLVDVTYVDGERYGGGRYTLFLRVDRLL